MGALGAGTVAPWRCGLIGGKAPACGSWPYLLPAFGDGPGIDRIGGGRGVNLEA